MKITKCAADRSSSSNYNPRCTVRALSAASVHRLQRHIAPRLTNNDTDVTVLVRANSSEIASHQICSEIFPAKHAPSDKYHDVRHCCCESDCGDHTEQSKQICNPLP